MAVSELRAHLREWLDRARAGEEVVVTDRGLPVARLLGMSATAVLERLTDDGVISRPEVAQRPVAAGRRRARAGRSLAQTVSDQRR